MKSGSNGPRQELFFIPWVGPSLNRIWAGIVHYKRTKIKKAGHWACIVVKGKVKPFEGPVDLVFTAQHPTKEARYDCTNYAVNNKVIEDGLVHLGILPEDGPDVVLSTRTDAPVYGKEPGTWVQIFEADADRVTALDFYRSISQALPSLD